MIQPAGLVWRIPRVLDVRNESWNDDEVFRTMAEDLIGNMHIAALGVRRLMPLRAGHATAWDRARDDALFPAPRGFARGLNFDSSERDFSERDRKVLDPLYPAADAAVARHCGGVAFPQRATLTSVLITLDRDVRSLLQVRVKDTSDADDLFVKLMELIQG